ncbi:MAG: MBL fold metallo-hydrolase [Clostridia bacterium]|nr:MBL fold metallo-hydrolase [Clostridia bacterium]
MAKKSSYKKAVKTAKKHPNLALAIAIIIIIIVAAIIIGWVLRPDIYHNYLNIGGHKWSEWETVKEATCGNGSKSRECLYCGETDDEVIKGSGLHNIDEDTGICAVCAYNSRAQELSIHFLELGNKYTGDCTLIKCGKTEVLIDAGSRKDSAATIKAYVDQYCEDGILEYVIATHAHQDHIAGFVGSSVKGGRTGILYQYQVGTLIQFAGTNSNTQIYKDYCKAVEYAKGNGTTVYTAKQCWYQTDGAKKQYFLDEAQTVSMNILYQRYYDEKTNDENDYSVCMLLTQNMGTQSFNYLFTGDLEEKGESSLVDKNVLPQVELFKGGHHGSYTASTTKLLNVIRPRNVAVCCCCGTTEYTSNPENTFPSQAFIDRVSVHTDNIYCTTLMVDYDKGKFTSMNGNIVFYTENSELKVDCSNNDIILKDTDWFKANRTWNGK